MSAGLRLAVARRPRCAADRGVLSSLRESLIKEFFKHAGIKPYTIHCSGTSDIEVSSIKNLRTVTGKRIFDTLKLL